MLQLNLKNNAISQTSESYNSMCKFGDVYLGASASGITRICGYADNGAEIPAKMRSGMFDMGTEKEKRVRFFNFGLETDGELILTIFCEGVQAAQYTISKSTGVQQIKVPISRAHHGRYWQWQIENVDGAFFALYSVTVLPIILR